MGKVVGDAVEAYLASLNHAPDAALREVAQLGQEMDLPLVDAEVGVLLETLVRATSASRVLEIGTAIGYSTIWLARGLPADGALFTIEIDARRAALARLHLERAGLSGKVHVMEGDAARLVHKVSGPFDLIFQDGHKPLYVTLLDRLVSLLRPGGLMVTDNVLWDGEVVPGFIDEPTNRPEDTEAIALFNQRLSMHPSLRTAWVPLRDGVALSVKLPSAAAATAASD
jgi:predicted O-methyltransferase YrrM